MRASERARTYAFVPSHQAEFEADGRFHSGARTHALQDDFFQIFAVLHVLRPPLNIAYSHGHMQAYEAQVVIPGGVHMKHMKRDCVRRPWPPTRGVVLCQGLRTLPVNSFRFLLQCTPSGRDMQKVDVGVDARLLVFKLLLKRTVARSEKHLYMAPMLSEYTSRLRLS